MNVLISLHKGYGLGDGVQMSAVLRHVRKYRPNWSVDYQAEEGKHQVGRGIVRATFAYGQPYPSGNYDAEVLICLYDTWANFGDRPNTRVSSCLHEQFGLPWDAECGRYEVAVSRDAEEAARVLVLGVVQAGHNKAGVHDRKKSNGYVAVHYEGDSSGPKKNLSHQQAQEICESVEKLGYTPLILDWRNRSRLDYRRITSPKDWGSDAERVCAVIRQCAAFVGIDSGPSKCASATDTPACVVWTGHHPAPFHDPAPNTTHLVPRGYHGLYPVCNDLGVMRWFEDHYSVIQYDDPVRGATGWLNKVLK